MVAGWLEVKSVTTQCTWTFAYVKWTKLKDSEQSNQWYRSKSIHYIFLWGLLISHSKTYEIYLSWALKPKFLALHVQFCVPLYNSSLVKIMLGMPNLWKMKKKLHKYVNKRSEFYLVKQVNVESWLIWSSSCCLLEQNRVYGSSKTFLVFLKINPIGFIGSIHKCTNLIVIISNEYYQTFYPCLKGMMAFLQHIIVSLWNIHGDTLIPCQELLECFHLWLIRFWYQVASQIGGVKHDYCHTENGP